MRAVSTTAGVGTVSECLALAKQWGFRPLALDSLSALKAPAELFEGDCLRVPEFPHRLIFVRHGETAYNAENRLQGQLDTPLNARGREQARAIGGTLRSLLGPEIDRLDEAQALFRFAPRARAGDDGDRARRDGTRTRSVTTSTRS